MAQLHFNKVGISALAACVPKNTIINENYTEHFPKEVVREIVDKTGILERRFALDSVCSSDLCYEAAIKLLNDNEIDINEIDLLVFISQTPDYRMPATSVLLQDRLKLGKHCMAFDVNLGCSGFVYGLSIVYSLMEKGMFRKALLLDGETRSRIYHPKDRKTAFLFGDAGIAALIEQKVEFGDSYFDFGTDGSKSDLISMKAGGYRFPSNIETLTEKVIDEHGNISTDEHGRMDGAEVFNFVLKEIPSNIKSVLKMSKHNIEDMDFVVMHQANNFMNGYLKKKFKLEDSKVPVSLNKFGNTSSVSIPLTIVSELNEKLDGERTLLLSGFGVGMSWGSAVIKFSNIKISELIEL